MAIVITDLNEFEIGLSDGFVNVTIWKQNIRFGTISGDILPLMWHNKAQTETRYKRDIDWNDVTAPVVVSAADLQSQIEDMIKSGWAGGAGDGGNVISAGGVTAASTGTVVFSNANNVTFGMAGNTVTASVSSPAQTEYFFSNSNGVTFGTAGSTVTASHNGLTSQSVQTQNMVSVLGSTGDISFANSNGITFGGNASTITASYTVPTITNSSWTASAGTQSATVSQLVWSNSNGVSFGLDAGTITASHDGIRSLSLYASGNTLTGGFATSAVDGEITFYGGGDVSVGFNNSSLWISSPINSHAFSATNGSIAFTTLRAFDSYGISFLTTVTNGSTGFVASHDGLTSQSNQALSGSNGSFTFQTATFGNLNGLSFYTSNGSLVGSYTVPSQSVQPVAVSGSNGSFTYSTVTFGNLNGASFYTSNGSMVMSYTVPAAGGALSLSAGTTSGTYNSLVFSNANGVSFGLNGSTVTGSVNAGGADITLSLYPDRMPLVAAMATQHSGATGNTGASTQITASYYAASIQVPHPVAFSSVWGFNCHSATSAGTGSATVGHVLGIYSLDANTALSLVSSWQWQMYVSQNSVTARSHKWFWGTDPSANSSGLSGNVSASFTNAGGAGFARRILMGTGDLSLVAGNYYMVSAYTARSAGANVFQAGSLACIDNLATVSALTMLGESSISQVFGFNGVFSSTTNISTIGVPILPSTVNTSAITIGATATGTHRTPVFIFARSKS